jgi:hypothetical protein
MTDIVATRLVRHLERARCVVTKRPSLGGMEGLDGALRGSAPTHPISRMSPAPLGSPPR